MRPHLYILDDDGNPVPLDSETQLFVWARWMETGKRHIRLTQVGPYRVSTVFLGLDHSFGWQDDDPPVLWETMVFASAGTFSTERAADLDCRRYTSRQDALDGHQTTCDLVALKVEQEDGKLPVIEEVETTR